MQRARLLPVATKLELPFDHAHRRTEWAGKQNGGGARLEDPEQRELAGVFENAVLDEGDVSRATVLSAVRRKAHIVKPEPVSKQARQRR